MMILLTLICSSGDGDFGDRVNLTAKRFRVCIRNGLLQSRSSCGRAILIAFHSVQGVFCGIDDEWRRVVATDCNFRIILLVSDMCSYKKP